MDSFNIYISVGANQTLTVIETEQQAVFGDVDFNGAIEPADVDWLRTAAEQPELYASVFGVAATDAADLNGDTVVDTNDVEHLLHVVVGTEYGDLNFDGSVDQTDLSLWHSGFGLLSGAAYAAGDVDGDHDADGADFLQLQRHVNSNGLELQTTPEPSTWIELLTSVCVLAACRPRR